MATMKHQNQQDFRAAQYFHRKHECRIFLLVIIFSNFVIQYTNIFFFLDVFVVVAVVEFPFYGVSGCLNF